MQIFKFCFHCGIEKFASVQKVWPTQKQAGAELGQAQLKLGLDLIINQSNFHWTDQLKLSFEIGNIEI